jgi:tRNA pseudouridine32 synthase / 23S rRNA pseudouridine746 synthase
MPLETKCFTLFKEDITSLKLPERFTFPFYYKPHPLTVIATKELQDYLSSQFGWDELFGLTTTSNEETIGKMFGVLVVKNKNGELGYISAMSGKLLDTNKFSNFVPPVFDIHLVSGFFNEGMKEVNQLIFKIKELEENPDFIVNQKKLKEFQQTIESDVAEAKKRSIEAKEKRDELRSDAKITLFGSDYKKLNDKLKQESANKKFYIKHLALNWEEKITPLKEKVNIVLKELENLKNVRQTKSASIQQQLFEQYNFLNANGETKNLLSIFKETALQRPPAAAGECAAPKLLHYAFKNNLTPIAMAEFWWGKSPKSEIRKHKNYYPACQGKCKPILGHMLKGLNVDNNPMLINPGKDAVIKTLFEDEYMLVINKPAELLSVPGTIIKDCVYQRMKNKYPKATGPLTVHRLDMQTSGIMLIAKSLETHKILQKQFMDRTIKKRYVALLDGIVKENDGTIDLPLAPDLEDRPRQLVCFEEGKSAVTHWKVLERNNNQTRIHFYPITGRTHQLRVHAAHQLGLNIPMVGDDLYGKLADRLYLHAEWIQFTHPVTNKVMKIEVAAQF